MTRIAICDDNPSIIMESQRFLERYSVESGEQFEIQSFSDGGDLLNDLLPGTEIIFLDISMNTIDGISVAKELRKRGNEAEIIFLTCMSSYALQGFSVHASGFLVKPTTYDLFKDELKIAFRHVEGRRGKRIILKNAAGTHAVQTKEILYAEVLSHTTDVVTINDRISLYLPLKKVSEMLDEEAFFRCHASYIVNMRYIRQIEGNNLILQNEAIIPLSKNRKLGFLKAYAAYVGGLI